MGVFSNLFGFGCCAGTGGGTGGTGTIPSCFCSPIPGVLTMTSADETCNFHMFQSGTLSYQARPAAYAGLRTLDPGYYGDQEWPDPLSGGSLFRYYLTCQYNQFSLSRIWAVSPYGSPYQDGILYTWLLGGSMNTCMPFRLDHGSAFPGSDATCAVTIDG